VAIERFGKYQVISKIGQGAMGEVYRARDTALNRDVAVKTIQAGDSSDETLQKRFLREARSAAGLNHPNIITVYDFGQEHGRLYMAMELLGGDDLKKAIAERSLRTVEQKLGIMEQIASGLAFAHENNVVHRDLKPANVHLQPDGTIKVMDFGLAKVSGSDMTRSGMIMGTPHYMSPEQVRGEKADARSDVFSLGCIFYEIVTSSKPFDADSMHAVLFKVLQEEPPAVRQITPNIPVVIAQIIETALSKDPEQRFANAGAFLETLQAARQAIEAGQGHVPLPDLPEPRSAEPAPAAVAAPGPRTMAPRSTPPAPAEPPPSGVPVALWIGLGLFLVAALAGGYWLTAGNTATPPQPVAPATPPPTDARMKMLAGTNLEMARRLLAAGNAGEALAKAHSAVSLDPQNAEARALYDDLNKRASERVDAAKAARAAAGAGDRKAAADALWTLLQLDPTDPAVAEVAPSVESELQAHAAEARAQLAEAQKAAEQAGLKSSQEFRDASRAVREGEMAAQAHKWATAASRWLVARDQMQRLTAAR
jgi:tRNA A-37 threonylcarbamoyl transferase component Bud32/tetratricopeptide (TPR) repeat protein